MKTIQILALGVTFGLITMSASAQQQQQQVQKVKAGYGVPVVQTEPEFPGGQEALNSFIHENLKYPTELRDSRTGGRVLIMFIVDKEGKIIDPLVIKGVSPAVNEEALRIIKLMPDWKPATNGGVPVNRQFILPIEFAAPTI